jgi:hypothetical protein
MDNKTLHDIGVILTFTVLFGVRPFGIPHFSQTIDFEEW